MIDARENFATDLCSFVYSIRTIISFIRARHVRELNTIDIAFLSHSYCICLGFFFSSLSITWASFIGCQTRTRPLSSRQLDCQRQHKFRPMTSCYCFPHSCYSIRGLYSPSESCVPALAFPSPRPSDLKDRRIRDIVVT